MSAGPRIKDIAEQLGVSMATVSRALNDKPGVAAETRQRVRELAAELDFVPNMAARSLNGSRTGAIAFVTHQRDLPMASDPFYYLILRGVERALDDKGYHVIISTVGERDEKNADDLRIVRDRRVDGLILAGPDLDPGLVLSIVGRGLPVVLVDNALRRTQLDTVLCDNHEGARAATDHLIEHGYRHIDFVGGPINWHSTRERQSGYEEALRDAGLESHSHHEAETSFASGLAVGRKLMAQNDRPRAVFAVNDAMALGVARAARDAGLSVPTDLALVGFDNIALAESTEPPLTTVHIAKQQMGALAARRLLELIDEQQRMPVKTVVSTELVVRSSCGCTVSNGG